MLVNKSFIFLNDWAKRDVGLFPVLPLLSHSHSVFLYFPTLPFSLLQPIVSKTLKNCAEHIVLIGSPWAQQDKRWKEYM